MTMPYMTEKGIPSHGTWTPLDRTAVTLYLREGTVYAVCPAFEDHPIKLPANFDLAGTAIVTVGMGPDDTDPVVNVYVGTSLRYSVTVSKENRGFTFTAEKAVEFGLDLDFKRWCQRIATRYHTVVHSRWMHRLTLASIKNWSSQMVVTDGDKRLVRDRWLVQNATYVVVLEHLPRGQGCLGSGTAIKYIHLAPTVKMAEFEELLATLVFGQGADATFIEALMDESTARSWLHRTLASRIEGGEQPHVFKIDGITVTMCSLLRDPSDRENHCVYAIAHCWGWQIFGKLAINGFSVQAAYALALASAEDTLRYLVNHYRWLRMITPKGFEVLAYQPVSQNAPDHQWVRLDLVSHDVFQYPVEAMLKVKHPQVVRQLAVLAESEGKLVSRLPVIDELTERWDLPTGDGVVELGTKGGGSQPLQYRLSSIVSLSQAWLITHLNELQRDLACVAVSEEDVDVPYTLPDTAALLGVLNVGDPAYLKPHEVLTQETELLVPIPPPTRFSSSWRTLVLVWRARPVYSVWVIRVNRLSRNEITLSLAKEAQCLQGRFAFVDDDVVVRIGGEYDTSETR